MHLATTANAAGADWLLLSPRHTHAEGARARRGHLRISYRQRQEPDDAARRHAPAAARQARRRGAPPDAVRRPDRSSRPALRDATTISHATTCTIEEREEYEPHLAAGQRGLRRRRLRRRSCARRRRRPTSSSGTAGTTTRRSCGRTWHIVVVDPHRPGHALRYYPEKRTCGWPTSVVVNKIDTADRARHRRLHAAWRWS